MGIPFFFDFGRPRHLMETHLRDTQTMWSHDQEYLLTKLEFSRRQIFLGGLVTMMAGSSGPLGVGMSAVPSAAPLSQAVADGSDTLTRMILDLVDEESIRPNYLARSAVRRIFSEAAQPGADARQVICKYFPDSPIGVLPGTGEGFTLPSKIGQVLSDTEITGEDVKAPTSILEA
jgi:hypothetical protein